MRFTGGIKSTDKMVSVSWRRIKKSGYYEIPEQQETIEINPELSNNERKNRTKITCKDKMNEKDMRPKMLIKKVTQGEDTVSESVGRRREIGNSE